MLPVGGLYTVSIYSGLVKGNIIWVESSSMFSSEKFSDSSDIGLVSRSECAYIKIPPLFSKKRSDLLFVYHF